MSQIFKSGDVVKLKSGGPDMTVENYVTDDKVTCVWFDSKNNYNDGDFQQDLLKKVVPKIPRMRAL
ncbi:MAG TPA: DUF2158 domain-containing protein [Bacteroidales bacterium]|nr:DUF2158 domain-containing protein [Bacteroidales bacterium]